MANECRDRLYEESFIKFTVFHESWVINKHNWDFDYDGCTWEIPESLAHQTPQGFTSREEVENVVLATDEDDDTEEDDSGGVSTTELDYYIVIACMASVLGMLGLFDVVYLLYRRGRTSDDPSNPNNKLSTFKNSIHNDTLR